MLLHFWMPSNQVIFWSLELTKVSLLDFNSVLYQENIFCTFYCFITKKAVVNRKKFLVKHNDKLNMRKKLFLKMYHGTLSLASICSSKVTIGNYTMVTGYSSARQIDKLGYIV